MLKPILEAYPDALGWKYKGYVPLLQSLGYKICVKQDTHPTRNQEGETIVLFYNGKKYGLLMYEWGYCSKTDMLQHCENLEEVKSLRNELKKAIKWFGKRELKKYLQELAQQPQTPWTSEWSKERWIQQRIWDRIGTEFLINMCKYDKGESYIGFV